MQFTSSVIKCPCCTRCTRTACGIYRILRRSNRYVSSLAGIALCICAGKSIEPRTVQPVKSQTICDIRKIQACYTLWHFQKALRIFTAKVVICHLANFCNTFFKNNSSCLVRGNSGICQPFRNNARVIISVCIPTANIVFFHAASTRKRHCGFTLVVRPCDVVPLCTAGAGIYNICCICHYRSVCRCHINRCRRQSKAVHTANQCGKEKYFFQNFFHRKHLLS